MRVLRWSVPLILLGVVVLGWARAAAPALSRVPTDSHSIALTFDDGPLEPYTAQILALLSQYHARATFFVLGEQVQQYPRLVQQEVRMGMEIGLHGQRHWNLYSMGAAYIVADAIAQRRSLEHLIPHLQISLYRPPFGNHNASLVSQLAHHRLTMVLWDVDTRDWAQPGVAAIVRTVEQQVRPGSIVLFHDGGGNRRQTVEALAILLPWLVRHHYALLTVSQLVQQAGI